MKKRKNMDNITKEDILRYESYLQSEHRSQNTVEKYVRDVKTFREYLEEDGGGEIDLERVMEYKDYLNEEYKISSANSMLVAINSFFEFMGWDDCKVKLFSIQKDMFLRPDLKLTEHEYRNLIRTAEQNGEVRLSMLIQTICSTGVRISELKYITVEALKDGHVEIGGTGKTRRILLSTGLVKALEEYCEKSEISSGSIFVTKGGQPVDRSNINKKMKELGREAGVEERKVFPHNLRHLFARTYFRIEKKVERLGAPSKPLITSLYTENTSIRPRQAMARMELMSRES